MSIYSYPPEYVSIRGQGGESNEMEFGNIGRGIDTGDEIGAETLYV